MKKLILSILISVIALQVSNANTEGNPNEIINNTVAINGKILDKETGEALTGVLIKIEETDKIVYSDFDGKFEFNDIELGTYNISVSYISYKKKVLKVVKAKSSVNTLKIELKKQ
ncbi:MAG: carboxypeptidase-like regulatory domain-containing protein [Bacteroidales bacterium]|nr:carboxypeptidase-like regulatory domain-containing protein [Bacteroidales bacterium]